MLTAYAHRISNCVISHKSVTEFFFLLVLLHFYCFIVVAIVLKDVVRVIKVSTYSSRRCRQILLEINVVSAIIMAFCSAHCSD